MTILITGGAGYIGTELVYLLAKNSAIKKIIVYDNLSRGNYNLFLGQKTASEKIQFINGDILDSRKIRKVLKGIDVVIHLAAKVTTPFANVDSHSFEQINHWGTAELVYAIEESEVKKFIFMSSASVYGSSSADATEETIPNPNSFYGTSKLRGEDHVKRLFDKTETTILRCGNVYGYSKSMRFDAVINKFMFDAQFQNRITINGNGKQFRSFIHIDKVIAVLEQMIFKTIPSAIYNLSDKNLEVNDLVEVMRNIYPGLEFMFVNQHLQMQQLKVFPDSKLYSFIPVSESDLVEELNAFKQRFSFSSIS